MMDWVVKLAPTRLDQLLLRLPHRRTTMDCGLQLLLVRSRVLRRPGLLQPLRWRRILARRKTQPCLQLR